MQKKRSCDLVIGEVKKFIERLMISVKKKKKKKNQKKTKKKPSWSILPQMSAEATLSCLLFLLCNSSLKSQKTTLSYYFLPPKGQQLFCFSIQQQFPGVWFASQRDWGFQEGAPVEICEDNLKLG